MERAQWEATSWVAGEHHCIRMRVQTLASLLRLFAHHGRLVVEERYTFQSILHSKTPFQVCQNRYRQLP